MNHNSRSKAGGMAGDVTTDERCGDGGRLVRLSRLLSEFFYDRTEELH